MTGRVMTGTMLEGNCQYGSSSFPWPQHNICHYSVQKIICLQLCQMVCAITAHVTVQILLCEKIRIPVTKIQTEKLRSLNFWKYHENCINASVSLALLSVLSLLSAKLWQQCKHCQRLRSREVRILIAISIFMSQALLLNHKTSVFTTMAPHLHNLLSHWHLKN